MKKKSNALHYCPSAKAHVRAQDGFETCATAHECYSDDPCPLMNEFLRQEVRPPSPPRTTPKPNTQFN